MKKLDKKKQMYITIVFIVALVIGVGYALLNSTLNITGNTKIKENSWDVHFENFSPKSGSVTATSAGINTAGTAVNYTVTLSKPGDFYEFTVDVVNEGSIDAMINTVSNTGLTTAQKRYMTYSVAYSDGTEIAEKQRLAAGKIETIKVKVEYKKDITASDLPSTEQTISLTFSVNYVQADGSSIPVRDTDIVCKRAKNLHTDTCLRTDSLGCKGVSGDSDTITYGSLGTTGTLAAGDAFDCDVNGDGIFNAENERFYYVAPLDTNTNYAVLIYYNNVTDGMPDSTTNNMYTTYPPKPRETGPSVAKLELPTISQWSNVKLSSASRKIKDEKGAEYINFSYEGYAARLLTYQEVVTACGKVVSTGYSGNCDHLLENTSYSNPNYVYGYSLENVSSTSDNSIQYFQFYPAIASFFGMGDGGIRPVIEVPKSKISY